MSLPNRNDQRLPLSSYERAVSVLTEYSGIVLNSYAKSSNETRDSIIRNFMARGITALRGVLYLWRAQDYHDCWVLYRAILDRLFHLETLGREDSFESFEKWCFKNAYKYKIRCLNDPGLTGKINIENFTPSQEDEKRFDRLNKENISWKRPRASEVAAKMKFDFLYYYGYDFASTYVHPTANEGQEDFARLTNSPMGKSFDDQITVIHNSCIATNIIFRQGLLFSGMQWRSPILKFLDDFLVFINGGPNNYIKTMNTIFQMVRDNLKLCQL